MKSKKMSLTALSFMSVFFMSSVFANASATDVIPKGLLTALTNLYNEYTIFVYGFISFGVLSGLLAFIILFMQLGAASTNPHARAFLLFEMTMVGLTTALLGGFAVVMEIYFRMFA